MSAPKYKIKTIEDFIAVPAEKRGDCLRDFYLWLAMADQKAEIDQALIALCGIPEDGAPLITNTFVWVDDGLEGISSIEIITQETA